MTSKKALSHLRLHMALAASMGYGRVQHHEPEPPPDPRIASEKMAAAQAKRDRKNAKRRPPQ